jgi:hypothetical protein
MRRTVLASVTANCEKLDLFAIAKGKTTRCEEGQLGTDQAIISDHSRSGWTTVETFRHYLDYLVEMYKGKSHVDAG